MPTKKTQAEVLRRENASEATVTAPTETKQPEATPEVSQGITLAPAIKTLKVSDSTLNEAFDGWSKSEVSDGRKTVEFAVEKMVGSAESQISIGERFNTFSEKHGEEKCRILTKALAGLNLAGLSASNIDLWRIRAVKLPEFIPNPAVRKAILALTGGNGIIVRDESSEATPKPYILSPFWAQAIAQIPLTASDDEEVAELNARKVATQAAFLRSNARTSPLETRITKKMQSFFKWLRSTNTLGKQNEREKLVYTQLESGLRLLIQETEDLTLVDHLNDVVVNAGEGKAGLNGQFDDKDKHTKTAKVA